MRKKKTNFLQEFPLPLKVASKTFFLGCVKNWDYVVNGQDTKVCYDVKSENQWKGDKSYWKPSRQKEK